MNKKSYKNYCRIGLIVFIVGLMVFGLGNIGLASGPLVEPISGGDLSLLIQTRQQNDDFPDPNSELLARPDGLELFYYKIDRDQDSIADGQTFSDNGFEVTIYKELIDGQYYFGFESNYPVMHVFAKGGPDEGNLYSYYPTFPDGVTSDSGLSQPGGDWSHIAFYYTEGMEELTVNKTVDTSFNREHFWDIDKEVTTDKGDFLDGLPKIWLIDVGDEEEATWEVDVTYLSFVDGDFNVSGTVTIENTGNVDAVITDIADVLGGMPIAVEFNVSFPYSLEAGETLTGSYSEDVEGMIEGSNEVTVTTERDLYGAVEPIVWEGPAEEINAVINIEDDSDLFEEIQLLGTLNAADLDEGEVTTFDYSNIFRWIDFEVGSYTFDNTATIVETEQSASAVLKVNVPEEEIMVSKTVETSFNLEHFWDIDKEVTTDKGDLLEGLPKIWLVFVEDEEMATWNVDVTYLGSENSDFNVFGTVTVENAGTIPAVITGYEDFLGGVAIDVDFGEDFELPYTLEAGETLSGTYSEDGFFEGNNEVTISTTKRDYDAEAEINWGDPDEETNAVVNIEDDSDLFEEIQLLGTLNAADLDEGEVTTFDYSNIFRWIDFEVGSYTFDNTVTIVETEQSASAVLKVNVPEEEIMVSKTVETSFNREHFWDIDKFIDTEFGYTVDVDTAKIWLFVDGSGDEAATWDIDVTYLAFEDSDFSIFGTVTVENTGTIPAVITGYEDFLGGVAIDVDFGEDFELPYTLEAGETLSGTYSEDGFFEGNNEVTISTTKRDYDAEAEINWEDPVEEINAIVTIEDDSDFFGLVELGTVDSADLLEGDVVNFNYDHLFEYGLYEGPAVIKNTAKIVESGQEASAILKINTQEFIYESAWAKGDGAVSFTDSGFSNWGWTNPIEEGTHEMDLWAGAAQSDTSKGTLVGTVTVVYNGGIDVTFNLDYGHTLEESHVYAGETMFPQQRRGQRTVDTVAPGQYYIEDDLSGEIWVIVHGVVGMPDPDFGPGSGY